MFQADDALSDDTDATKILVIDMHTKQLFHIQYKNYSAFPKIS